MHQMVEQGQGFLLAGPVTGIGHRHIVGVGGRQLVNSRQQTLATGRTLRREELVGERRYMGTHGFLTGRWQEIAALRSFLTLCRVC